MPITLQTFGVILAGLVLGWRRGGLAALLYLALGLVGLPIFAEGTGGVAVLSKPSVGYLLAFPVAAALAGVFATLGAACGRPLRGADGRRPRGVAVRRARRRRASRRAS